MRRLWLLYGVVAAAIIVTYARLPAHELYHVSGSGLEGGASRALVFLNFPLALMAIGLLWAAWDRLPRRARGAAVVAAALCAVVVWPGVVDEGDLDARAVNAVPAAGVALALVLTLRLPVALPWDRARYAIAVVLGLAAIPWMAADLGFDFAGVPVLGSIFQTGELRSQPGLAGLHPAVHHGHHHGMDGLLLALTALTLSRGVRSRPLAGYLALMLAYGVVNLSNDFWLEQGVKRGWTDVGIPSVLQPAVNWGWLAIVLSAIGIWIAWFAPRLPRSSGRTAGATAPPAART